MEGMHGADDRTAPCERGEWRMSDPYKLDAVIVGGGVIGLAVGRALALGGREVTVLEAEPITGNVISARNSEVIHAGLYYPTDSLKARLCVEGKEALYAFCKERGVAHRRCEKLVVAANEPEIAYLQKLEKQALANEVEDCILLDDTALRSMEPSLTGAAALLSPSTGIVDSHGLMAAYITDIESCGGSVVTRSPVLGGKLADENVYLDVGGRDPFTLQARLVVNCAGLNAWTVSTSIAGLHASTIPARYLAKGTYFSLVGRAPSQRLIYPVPEPGGLGVHLTLDLAGQARFGPDVEWVENIDYEVDPRRADKFYASIRRYWPALPNGALQPAYSGVRPKVAGSSGGVGDFVIQGPSATGHPGYIALYGIESPGLTASLAIGRAVATLVASSIRVAPI
jgi:L-2-hydroxyglutarate oxidase LhgO